jgi:hypothetical protein
MVDANRWREADESAGPDEPPENGDALDLLEYEDRALLRLFSEFDDPELVQADHGVVGKLLVEHMAVREAAKEEVGGALATSAITPPQDLVLFLNAGVEPRRAVLTRLDELARGIRPINLNQGQDYDGAVAEARSRLGDELRMELDTIIPALREWCRSVDAREVFRSAKFVRGHAPTHPSRRRHWYERLAPIVRLHAIYDFLRGFPTKGAKPSAEFGFTDDERPL